MISSFSARARNVGAKLLRIPTRTKRRIRNIRKFLVALGLIAMTGTKGRAFIHDWNRNRQRRKEEEFKKKKDCINFTLTLVSLHFSRMLY